MCVCIYHTPTHRGGRRCLCGIDHSAGVSSQCVHFFVYTPHTHRWLVHACTVVGARVKQYSRIAGLDLLGSLCLQQYVCECHRCVLRPLRECCRWSPQHYCLCVFVINHIDRYCTTTAVRDISTLRKQSKKYILYLQCYAERSGGAFLFIFFVVCVFFFCCVVIFCFLSFRFSLTCVFQFSCSMSSCSI